MPVNQGSGLVDVGRGETVGVSLVVGQLGVDVVEDIPLSKKSQSDNGRTFQSLKKTYDVLQCSGTTEGEVLKFG